MAGARTRDAPDLAADAVQTMDAYARRYRTDTLWFDTLKVSGDSGGIA